MQFPNGSGKDINMMYPVDNTYWSKLKKFVDYEPISAIDPELRGVLASLGIVKGQPFEPTAKQQNLLKKAIETAPKMILATRQLGRPDGRNLYYKDRKWENVWGGATSEWLQASYIDPDQRAGYFQVACRPTRPDRDAGRLYRAVRNVRYLPQSGRRLRPRLLLARRGAGGHSGAGFRRPLLGLCAL